MVEEMYSEQVYMGYRYKKTTRPDKATENTAMSCHYTSLQCYREAREAEDLVACQLLDLI